jgi:hypothetical protein
MPKNTIFHNQGHVAFVSREDPAKSGLHIHITRSVVNLYVVNEIDIVDSLDTSATTAPLILPALVANSGVKPPLS